MSEENGLLAVQNSVSDADLIAELTEEVDKAVAVHETEAEAQRAGNREKMAEVDRALAALDGPAAQPEVEVRGERVEGITEATVAGDKAGEATVSDRSILRDQLVEFANSRKPAEPTGPSELEQLRAANAALIFLETSGPSGFPEGTWSFPGETDSATEPTGICRAARTCGCRGRSL